MPDARDYAHLWAWEPIHPEQMVELLAGFPGLWWICGGWALDLFLARETRRHDDLDVAVLRHDQLALFHHFRAWDLHYATPAHALAPWDGQHLEMPIHGIWGRRSAEPNASWTCEFLLNEERDGEWLFRRDEAIRRPWRNSGMRGIAFPSSAPRSSGSTSRASARRRTTRTSPPSCHVSLAKRVFGCGRHSKDTTPDTPGLRHSLPTVRDFGEPFR